MLISEALESGPVGM